MRGSWIKWKFRYYNSNDRSKAANSPWRFRDSSESESSQEELCVEQVENDDYLFEVYLF